MSEKIQILKFGGTSVGDAECIRRAVKIITTSRRKKPVVVVVSAMSGVTNRLMETAHQCAQGKPCAAEEIKEFLYQKHVPPVRSLISEGQRRRQLIGELGEIIGHVTVLCREVAHACTLSPLASDAIASVGERLSARLVAAALCEEGWPSVPLEATELIVTDEFFGRAEPLMKPTCEQARRRLLPFVLQGMIPVVTGFIGSTQQGRLTTLGRGGSDFSATILGAALDASEVVIWTDVDGVLTADPWLVPNTRTLHSISYKEAAELAYFGAKVLHPKTLQPVERTGIPVWIRNSFAPERIGTKVSRKGDGSGSAVKAIAAMREVSLITISGPDLVRLPDAAAKVLPATAEVRADVLLISPSSSNNEICLLVKASDKERTLAALQRVLASQADTSFVDSIEVDSNVALIALVGEKMRRQPRVTERVFTALGREHMDILAIAQGSSGHNLSFVVEASAMAKAVAVLHQEFGLGHKEGNAPHRLHSNKPEGMGLQGAENPL